MLGTTTPFEESLKAMFEMQKEGKIMHVGVSNVTPEELNTALSMGRWQVLKMHSVMYNVRVSVFGQDVKGILCPNFAIWW